MKLQISKYYPYLSLILVTILPFLLGLVCSCQQRPDHQLAEIDALMESRPDSALSLLNDYRLSKGSSSVDSAYYGLLLTHARYRNFIDEISDSLISRSADYYIDRGDKERAARSLFLQGMIEYNAGRLGEAAVSFTKGLDLAHESKSYRWEGQCARGLCRLYGKLMNSSEQLRFANLEYDAFLNGKYEDWTNYALMDIATAHNNSGQYKEAIKQTDSLIRIAEREADTLLMAEILTVRATGKYSLGNYSGALEDFFTAYELDSTMIDDKDAHNVSVAAADLNIDIMSKDWQNFIRAVRDRQEVIPPFRKLADQGNFHEAYLGIERYKELQDSVLGTILHSNVSWMVGQYESTKRTTIIERQRHERVLWSCILLALTMVGAISGWAYRKRLQKNILERDRLEDTLDLLRSDLQSQIKSMKEMVNSNSRLSEKCELMSSYLRDYLLERYKKANDLCDSYFQDRLVRSKNSILEKEIKSLLSNLSNSEFIHEVGTHIDRCMDGLYSSFNADFPDLSVDARRLFIFLTLGFSSRTICVILDIETANLYNRKSRLKKIIASSNASKKEEYIEIISR